GKTYRVEVSHPGYDDVNCETTIPLPTKILNVDTTNVELSYYIPVRLTFKDSTDFNNYYRIFVRAKWGSLVSDYGDAQNDTVIVYTKTFGELDTDDVLIKGVTSRESDKYMVGSPENNYNIFTDKTINGQEYTITFTIPGIMLRKFGKSKFQPERGEFYFVEIELQSISPDEYLYLSTINSYFFYGYDMLSEPVMVYSNIENGAGIFAGYAVDRCVLSEGEYPKEGIKYVYDIK
ncbi:MAG: DUF4249 family protein, partial [Prolixibacteraceae bacterium]|nr:DUF4249 family protein [Prolixibacteraceae bacterium]